MCLILEVVLVTAQAEFFGRRDQRASRRQTALACPQALFLPVWLFPK